MNSGEQPWLLNPALPPPTAKAGDRITVSLPKDGERISTDWYPTEENSEPVSCVVTDVSNGSVTVQRLDRG